METRNYSFKELLSVIVDNRGKTCPTSENGLPLIATNCIKMDSIYPLFIKVRYVSKNTYETWFRGHPEPGDIIFVCKGSPGRVALAPNPVNFCIAQDMLAIRANEKIIDQKFLFALLRSKLTQRKILNMHVGSLIPHFKKGDFGNLFFDIPIKMSIQKCIGEIYYTFSRKIELNRKMNETLEAMAQAMFKSWFVDFDPVLDNALAQGHEIPEELKVKAERRKAVLDSGQYKALPKDIQALFPASFVYNEELGKWIPEGWDTKTLEESTSIIIDHRGKTPKKMGGEWVEEGFPAISAKNVKNGSLIRHDMIRYVDQEIYNKWMKNELKKGDIVMTSEAPMGEMLLILDDTKYCLSQRLYAMRANGVETTSSFLYYWLQSDIARGDLEGRCTGTTVTGIKQSELRKVLVLISNKALLYKFEELIGSTHVKVNNLTKQIMNLTKQRDVLLSQLISGKTRLPASFIQQFESKTEPV